MLAGDDEDRAMLLSNLHVMLGLDILEKIAGSLD
jgi:hypothetical protein